MTVPGPGRAWLMFRSTGRLRPAEPNVGDVEDDVPQKFALDAEAVLLNLWTWRPPATMRVLVLGSKLASLSTRSVKAG